MDVAINPPNAVQAYLKHLNASFGDWGDAARFRWAFERTASAPRADLMVLSESGETLAGSAVTYRTARLGASGVTFRVGIMTGSWTLPAARGRGCFTRVIQESVQLCQKQGAALLLAFVTEDNASYRRLKEAGAVLVQTRYWIFPAATSASGAPPLRPIPADAAALHAAHEARTDDGLRFTYDRDGWAGQFLKRSTPTEVVTLDAGTALIERAATTDRILALYPRLGDGPRLVKELHAQAQRAGRGMFSFTDAGARTAWFEPLGVAPKPGFLTVIAAAKGATPEVTALALENGDRM